MTRLYTVCQVCLSEYLELCCNSNSFRTVWPGSLLFAQVGLSQYLGFFLIVLEEAVWSGSTLFAQVCLSQCLRLLQ